MTNDQFWDFIDTHSDSAFYALYNSTPQTSSAFAAMSAHMDYLVGVEIYEAHASERKFGC